MLPFEVAPAKPLGVERALLATVRSARACELQIASSQHTAVAFIPLKPHPELNMRRSCCSPSAHGLVLGRRHEPRVSAAKPPVVYDYLDYRAFLRAYYEAKKAADRGFSFRVFARLAGVKASNHLKLVMDGKRGLPEATARRYAQAMGLHSDEAEYFCDLTRFNQAASPSERSALYRRLTGFRGYRNVQRLELEHAAYHANWYIPAIRELAARRDFVDDPAWIADQLVPAISKADAKRALTTLFSLGLLHKHEDGTVSQGEAVAATAPETVGVHVANYHRAMLELAAQSIDRFESSEREISSLTMCVGPEDVVRLKRHIQRFEDELVAFATDVKQGDRVVQLNFQLFPLSRGARHDD